MLKPINGEFFHYWGYLDGLEGGFTSPENNRYESDHFVGRKSKDGTEIYEGDFVKVNGRGNKQDVTTRVLWSERSNGFTTKTNPTLLHDHAILNISKLFEVVGNIHQNPEWV